MSDSEGSDIDVEGGEFDQGIDGEEAGDPLDRAQVEVNADCGDGWLAAMFGDDDDDDDSDFWGFQNEWITDDARFRPPTVPTCTLDGGTPVQHPEETTAGFYFNLLWDDQVNYF